MGFEIHLQDLLLQDTAVKQMANHQFQQTGFSAAADAGNHFYRFCILKSDELFEINIPVFELIRYCHTNPSF